MLDTTFSTALSGLSTQLIQPSVLSTTVLGTLSTSLQASSGPAVITSFYSGLMGPAGPAGPVGPVGPAGPAGSDADTTALRDELIGTGGGSTVSNGTYDGTTLHYTGGEALQGTGAFGCVLVEAGAKTITVTVPNFQGGARAYIILSQYSNSLQAFTSAQPPINVFISRDAGSGNLVLFASVQDGSSSPPLYNCYVNLGDSVELAFTVSGLTVSINGTEVWSGTSNVPLLDHFIHVMPFSIVGSDTIPDVQVSGLAAAGTTGLIDTLIHAQVDPVVTAQASIYQRLSAVESVNTAQGIAISDIQSLAETNQLNINTKTDQTDFDSLAEIVTDNGLLLASRASQSDLDTLATEVSTKATPADISAAIAALVDGAPASLDTLAEIAAALAGDAASINDLLTQINSRVRFDAAQSLTTAQQLQARQNISAEQVGVAAALIAAITAASIGAATAAQGSKADSALQSGDVAPVALSGSYTALTDKPTIPAAQVNADWNSNSGLSQILNKPTLFGLSSLLTGLGAGSNTAITAADSLINALAKLQSQVSTNASSASTNASNIAANSALITPVRKKIGGAWYVTGFLYDCIFPYAHALTTTAAAAGTQLYFPFQVLENVTFSQIIANVTTVGAGSTFLLGIYDSDSLNTPNNLIVKSTALDSSTLGLKTFNISQSFTTGQVIWVSLLMLGANASFTALVGSCFPSFKGGTVMTNVATGMYYRGSQTDMQSSAAGALAGQNANFPRICLKPA